MSISQAWYISNMVYQVQHALVYFVLTRSEQGCRKA